MLCSQIEPPGMNMIHLPFADDLRSPEGDPAFVGEGHKYANADQVKAAEAMIDALPLNDFSVGQMPNPVLQRHFEVCSPGLGSAISACKGHVCVISCWQLHRAAVTAMCPAL